MITPESFQSTALAWITMVTIVSGALIAAVLAIWSKITDLRIKVAMATAQTQAQGARLDDHSRRIDQVKPATNIAEIKTGKGD